MGQLWCPYIGPYSPTRSLRVTVRYGGHRPRFERARHGRTGAGASGELVRATVHTRNRQAELLLNTAGRVL
jgi:hypothetical protein